MSNAPNAVDLMKAAAEATRGPDTPESASVTSKPPDLALRALVLAGPALSSIMCWALLMLSGVGIGIGSWMVWPGIAWPREVAESRVQGVVAIAMSLSAILGVVVFRLASGSLRKAEARIGPAGFTVESGDGPG